MEMKYICLQNFFLFLFFLMIYYRASRHLYNLFTPIAT